LAAADGTGDQVAVFVPVVTAMVAGVVAVDAFVRVVSMHVVNLLVRSVERSVDRSCVS
jgi:hypothetical protein